MYKYLKKIDNTECIWAWKSKGLFDESIKPRTKSDNSLAPGLSYIGDKTKVKFDGGYLKQDKFTFTHKKTVNIYIAYEINLWNYIYSSNPTQGKFLFGAVKLVKNDDIDK